MLGQNPATFLERLSIEHDFKVRLAKIWFLSRNKKERVEELNKKYPGLLEKVGYTKIWEYVRTEIDEFMLREALSQEQIAQYLRINEWKLKPPLKTTLERALKIPKRSFK